MLLIVQILWEKIAMQKITAKYCNLEPYTCLYLILNCITQTIINETLYSLNIACILTINITNYYLLLIIFMA